MLIGLASTVSFRRPKRCKNVEKIRGPKANPIWAVGGNVIKTHIILGFPWPVPICHRMAQIF